MRIGAEVRPGDILVGKVTPKGETQLSPGGEAPARHLRREGRRREGHQPAGAPGGRGDRGRRQGVQPQGRWREGEEAIEEREADRLRKEMADEIAILRSATYNSIRQLLVGEKVAIDLVDLEGGVVVKEGGAITDDAPGQRPPGGVGGDPSRGRRRQGGPDLRAGGPARRPERRRASALRGADRAAPGGRRPAAGRDQDGQGVRGHQAPSLGRGQDGGPPRQQGRHLQDRAGGGHAVPGGRRLRWTSSSTPWACPRA